MINNSAVASLIRRNQIGQLYTVIQTSLKEGMIAMNKAIDRLRERELIGADIARKRKRDLATQAAYY